MFYLTKRLLMRPAWPEDWRAVLAAVGHRHIIRNLARAPWPYGEAEAREWLAHQPDPAYPRFLLIERESGDGVLIGSAGFAPDEEGPEIGYWIAEEYWNRGYASEAACALVEIARVIGHRNLVSGHFVDNPASGAVLRKAGFSPTGAIRTRDSAGRGETVDCVMYARQDAR